MMPALRTRRADSNHQGCCAEFPAFRPPAVAPRAPPYAPNGPGPEMSVRDGAQGVSSIACVHGSDDVAGTFEAS